MSKLNGATPPKPQQPIVLERPEEVILAVSHALPSRYVLDASDGAFPGRQVTAGGARAVARSAARYIELLEGG